MKTNTLEEEKSTGLPELWDSCQPTAAVKLPSTKNKVIIADSLFGMSSTTDRIHDLNIADNN